MKRLFCALVCFLLSLSAVSGFAHDLIVPIWRGIEGTTFQEWDFSTPSDPALPEIISNPFGDASADITVGQFGSGWHQQLPGMGTQTGYWDIGDGGGSIIIDIDNSLVENPFKEIWIQITYYNDITAAPIVDVQGGVFVGSQLEIPVEHVPTGGDWLLDQYVFRMYPNPSHEQIVILADPRWMSVIDQVVVDTFCVPEPASLSLLAFGGIAFLFRRFKK
jgi:hypothetical protein